jgi:hypothetical protein
VVESDQIDNLFSLDVRNFEEPVFLLDEQRASFGVYGELADLRSLDVPVSSPH